MTASLVPRRLRTGGALVLAGAVAVTALTGCAAHRDPAAYQRGIGQTLLRKYDAVPARGITELPRSGGVRYNGLYEVRGTFRTCTLYSGDVRTDVTLRCARRR
jgi:hypothetical protein